ncbi:MAG: HAMP domain-containing sensor histidine kinase [Nanoarchaeota archaeon]
MSFSIKTKIVFFTFIISFIVSFAIVFFWEIGHNYFNFTNFNQVLFFFFLILFSLVFLLSILFSYSILKPIKNIMIATQIISSGRYDHKLKNKSNDEFGKLSNAFNSMTQRLKQTVDQKTHFSNIAAQEKCKSNLIIDSMAESVIVADDNYKILIINSAAEELFEINGTDVINMHLIHFFRKFGMTDIIEKYPTIDKQQILPMRNPNPTIIESIMQRPKNKILKFTIAPVLNEKKFSVGSVAIIQDITKLKEIDRMKSDFISIVSHELRTPLTSILGYTSLILTEKMGKINEKQKKSLEIIDRESKRLSYLVEDILDLSKLESGKIKLKIEKINLLDILKSNSGLTFAKKKNIEVEIMKNLEDIYVYADKNKISQVFTNLITNSVKFSRKNTKITIKFTKKKDFIQIDIIDTGIGIKKDDIIKLFNRFYQVQNHLTRQQQTGTGLGLAIVKEIIYLHCGIISIVSKYKKGTTFSFTLPTFKFKQKQIEKKCFEIFKCNKKKCLSHESIDDRCWLQPATLSKKKSMKPCFDKINLCKYCEIYKNSFEKIEEDEK